MAVFLGALLDPKAGYSFLSRREGDLRTVFMAYDRRGNFVGDLTAQKGRDKGGEYLIASGIWIAEGHRRRGLATELYRRAERELGAKFRPSTFQSNEGRAFWAQPNRPFGGVLPAAGEIPAEEVLEAMWRLRVTDIPFDLLREGMAVEREHADLTRRDAIQTARIALAHLRERRDYYKRLKQYVER
jgi:GNAT superfamily N-acetyltransferase